MAKTKKQASKDAQDGVRQKLRSKGSPAAGMKQLLSETSSDDASVKRYVLLYKGKFRKVARSAARLSKLSRLHRRATPGAVQANEAPGSASEASSPLSGVDADDPSTLVGKVLEIGVVLSILPKARDQAMDMLFDLIDSQMKAAEFSELSAMCGAVARRAGRLPSELLLGLLTATLPARSQLPDRAGLCQATRKRLDELGELEDGLLDGLD